MAISPFLGSLMCALSYIYVKIWVPIRLTYLRLKFRIIPYFRVIFETFSLVVLIICAIPAGFMLVCSKIVESIGLVWLCFVCMFVDLLLGNEIGTFYKDVVHTHLIMEDDHVDIEITSDDVPMTKGIEEDLPEPEKIDDPVPVD